MPKRKRRGRDGSGIAIRLAGIVATLGVTAGGLFIIIMLSAGQP